MAADDRDGRRDDYLRRAGQDHSVLLSGETIAPLMRIAKRGSLLRSGAVRVTLACPKTEASGPCRGPIPAGALVRANASDALGNSRLRPVASASPAPRGAEGS